MRMIATVLIPWLALSLALGAPARADDTSDEADSSQLKVEGRLQKNVQFWIDIYGKYTTQQGVVHDAKYVDHIYEVLDLSGRHDQRKIRKAIRKWRRVLLSVERKQDNPRKMDADELKVYKMFQDVHEDEKFLNAAHRKRLRFQLGQKDQFERGLKYSGRYLPAMESIFRKEGLPVELTRLPFVESSFNIHARSKVGASGIWQFMRSTGRLFLSINRAVDERNDPIRATEAAAKLLKANYESLGNWPLAVTAYNHGRKGMMRAVREVGSTRLEDIVEQYRSRTFGFASRNFFTCLLAAIYVEEHAEKFFGKVERLPPVQYAEVELPDSISLRQLTRFLHLDLQSLKKLNPGLSSSVFRGRRRVPAGYILKLPADEKLTPEAQARVFLAGYEKIPRIYKVRARHRRKYDKRVTASQKD